MLSIFFNFANLLYAEEKLSQNKSHDNGVLVDGYYPTYPQPIISKDNDATLIKKGEYLAKMGDCIACHTNINAHDNAAAFSGGLPIVTPFGTIYSPNITPDKETGIGNWTLQDFIRAMKQGRDPN